MTSRPGPKAKALIARDEAALSPSYTRGYPLAVDHGRGCELWDVDGNRYIDFAAGIAVASTGHCHPRVVEAIQAQAAKLIHIGGTDFYYELQVAVAERLDLIAPFKDDALVFLTNSGAETIEAAAKLARWTTDRPRYIAFLGGFHGRTMGALSFTASKAVQRAGFFPYIPGVEHVPFPNPRDCMHGRRREDCVAHCYCVDYIEDVIFTRLFPAQEVAAILVEPIQGEGGYIVPPANFFKELRALCDRYGILLIVDEVQSGMGRTGKWFGIQHWGVEPDMVCVAKGIASGMPLGALIARKQLMDWPPGAHANTFGGNPVACAAALVTMDLLEHGDAITGGKPYMQNAAEVGEHLLDALVELQGRHPTIADVRGKGLMIGAEIRIDGKPATAFRNHIADIAYEKGLVLLPAGPTTMRFAPPLNISKSLVDEGLMLFDAAVTDAERELH